VGSARLRIRSRFNQRDENNPHKVLLIGSMFGEGEDGTQTGPLALALPNGSVESTHSTMSCAELLFTLLSSVCKDKFTTFFERGFEEAKAELKFNAFSPRLHRRNRQRVLRTGEVSEGLFNAVMGRWCSLFEEPIGQEFGRVHSHHVGNDSNVSGHHERRCSSRSEGEESH